MPRGIAESEAESAIVKPCSTKEAMVVAAERRFALQGLEGVSLRQIALDSNQRNESAAHYHFGSREGLIRAILSHRISRINERREEWFSQLTHTPAIADRPRIISSVVIYPLAAEILNDWRQCYWVRFMTQLFAIDKYRSLADEFEAKSPALSRAYEILMTIPGIDPTVLNVRREILRRDVVWGLARVEAMSFHQSRELCELHVANLVDMIAAGISAPTSAETLLKMNALTACDDTLA